MIRKLIGALLLAATAPACAQAPLPDADPAIWVVKDADTTLYLFGTVHAFDGKKAWFNDAVKDAYDRSQEVVFEVLFPEPAKVQATILERAVDKSGRTLSSRLSAEQAGKVASELAAAGVPLAAFDRFEPWFAAIQLAQLQYMKQGIVAQNGVESVLRDAARKDGKAMGEVESFDWQMNLFDTLPEALQLKMLTDYLDEMDKSDAMLGKMMESWAAGDIDTLAGVLNEALSASPELFKPLLADRNARWAEWIQKRMERPGTVFMAVGAGHLGGRQSVQEFLAGRGIKAERVVG